MDDPSHDADCSYRIRDILREVTMAKLERPKWDQSQDYAVGLEALELAKKYKKALETRIPSGLLEGLREDINTLGAMGEEKKKTVARVKGFTGTQAEALKAGINWCSLVREALKRGRAKEEVKKAAGVGMVFSRGSVPAVTAALNAIIETYDRFADVFRDCGVLPDDIVAGKSLLAALQLADVEQEAEKIKKKETTQSRNALRLRIENAVDRVVGAAGMAFAGQPDVLKLFTDLIPGNGRKKAKPDEEKKA